MSTFLEFIQQMTLADPTFWWLLAGVAVVLELLSGTFYLLMLALGLSSAALVAHAGVSMPLQISTAAVVASGAVLAWYLRHSRQAACPEAGSNRDVNLDIGETVRINAWNADGTANVQYRGANWTVIHAPGASPSPGMHRVCEMVGSRLVVEKI